jgi:protein dithiol oxidoreductase (disulfide-forming)
MKQFIPLILALSVMAGCGQSEPAATAAAVESRPAAAAAGATAPAATAATTAAAVTPATPPAADQAAEHAHETAATVSAAAPSASAATATSAGTPPAAAAAAGQVASQTAPGIMTDPVAAAGFVEGRNFVRLSGLQPTTATPGQVEVNEFFMYSCIHCYNLEPYVQAWLPNKPAHINFVRVPTTWNEVVKLHAQAFYAAAALGKGEEMNLPFFQEMHVNGNYLETPAELREFFGRFGVSGSDFDGVIGSFSVISQVNRADELAGRYRVDSTPTIIVAGKYRTGVSEAGSPERLFELIEALAAAELIR